MQQALDWLQHATDLSPATVRRILLSILVIAVVWIVRQLALLVVHRRTQDLRARYRWKKSSAYVAFLLAALLVGRLWFAGFRDLATYLGLLSAGLAIALKDPLTNLAGWAFIIWRRPFEVGDRIQVGRHAGDVIDLRIFQFTLMEIGNWVDADQSTGRVIHLPNGQVFTEAVANFSKGFQYIWNEIPVLVTFESDWRKAKEILHRIAQHHAASLGEAAAEQVRKAARKFLIFYSKLTPTVYTSVKDSGVLLTIRYLCEPRRRRGSAQAIWEEILSEFSACDEIDFAYPTQRFYDNLHESKTARSSGEVPAAPGAGGEP